MQIGATCHPAADDARPGLSTTSLPSGKRTLICLLGNKISLGMKLSTWLLLALLLQSYATVNAQTVNYNASAVELKKVLSAIREQTGYVFFYDREDLKEARPVTCQLKNASLQTAMDAVLVGQPLRYTIQGKTVLIVKNIKDETATTRPNVPSANPISGRVTDETGVPIPGVTVLIKGTLRGAQTNATGDYRLTDVKETDVLVFSFIGYTLHEVTAGKKTVIDVRMLMGENKLDETIVRAYGSTSRRLNTGNIDKVGSREIASQPVGNVLAALDGRVPGMTLTQGSGLPGSGFRVQVRGRTAIDRGVSDDQPLFVIDGVPFNPNNGFLNKIDGALGKPSTSNNNTNAPVDNGGISPLASLNPQDIESIEVLKDADATAIYGSRGANGVVLITTKKGKSGKTTLSFNTYNGFSLPSRPVKMLDTRQYLDMRRKAYQNGGEEPEPYFYGFDLLVWDTTRYTNFRDLLTKRNPATNDVQLSLSGGTENTQFLVGGSYHRETSVIPGNMADRKSAVMFNIHHRSTDKRFNMTFSGNYANDKNNLIRFDPASQMAAPPNQLVYNPDGSLGWDEGGLRTIRFSESPMAFLHQTYDYTLTNLIANLQLSYKLTADLTARVNTGYNTTQAEEQMLKPQAMFSPSEQISREAHFSNNQFRGWIIEPQVEYNRYISQGKLNVLAGGTWQSTDNNSNLIIGTGFSSDALMQSLAAATALETKTERSQYRYQAFFGRLGYNWNDKYMVNLSARRDGSSRFGRGRRYADFGAVGAAWIFTNETWAEKKLPFLSFGKLRASYGTTGNDKIRNYEYLDTWKASRYPYSGLSGLFPDKLYNNDYRWETTNKLEGALELGFLDDRILFSTAWYRNRSSNQLISYNLPYLTGFNSVVANLPALVQNTGWEFSFTSNNIKKENISWTTTANLTVPKNKLVSFPGLDKSSYYAQYVLGQPLNLIYRYKSTGVDPQTGVFTFEDVNQDGELSVPYDYQVLGHLDPVFYGGLQNSIQYKSLQLDFFFSFTRQTGRNYLAGFTAMPGNPGNLPEAMMKDFWSKPGDHAALQQLSMDMGDIGQAWSDFRDNSNGVYGDASFIRLKNVSLSWSLPSTWLSRMHLQTGRVYAMGQNLLTITGYKIGDPEIQDIFRTPPMKIFTAGVQFTL